MTRKVVMTGKRMKPTLDARSLRGLDPEIVTLLKEVLHQYGLNGTKTILHSIVIGKLKLMVR